MDWSNVFGVDIFGIRFFAVETVEISSTQVSLSCRAVIIPQARVENARAPACCARPLQTALYSNAYMQRIVYAWWYRVRAKYP